MVVSTAAFAAILQTFFTTIFLAAVFAGLSYPVYVRLRRACRGHRQVASALTTLLVFALVLVPLLGVFGVVVSQALRIADSVTPVVERLLKEPTYVDEQLRRIPGLDRIEPYRGQIVTTAGELTRNLATYLVGSLSSMTRGTVQFVFGFFILLYTMFFFLTDGPAMLATVLHHLPLTPADKRQMIDRFVSVTRATIKGTIIIGIVQGTLSGVAFRIAGIPDALFWSVVMVLLSILPVVGGALVWVPACLILAATGHVGKAAALAAFCALVVGSVDNLLRPWLVGRDTKMHDLVILFSTLGGIFVFGPAGFIVGPILAGLFITSWDLFAVAYQADASAPGKAPDLQPPPE